MDGNKTYEKNIHKAIIKELNNIPHTKVWKRRATAYNKGKSDITGSCFGFRVEIEVKVPGQNPTLLQQKWLDEMEQMWCIAGCARSVDDALMIVETFLKIKGQHETIQRT